MQPYKKYQKVPLSLYKDVVLDFVSNFHIDTGL